MTTEAVNQLLLILNKKKKEKHQIRIQEDKLQAQSYTRTDSCTESDITNQYIIALV